MHQRPYQKLVVWQEAHQLCLRTYKLTQKFPPEERYGLKRQMQNSSSSVPTNIAEANLKSSMKEKVHFYEIAQCSLEELHYQYVLAHDLGYTSDQEFLEADDHIQRVSFLLSRLKSSVHPR